VILERFGQSMAGVIVLDHAGRVGFAHCSPKIAVAWADENGQIVVQMKK